MAFPPAYRHALIFLKPIEGGFVDDPDDPGGATNAGITQATYDAWRTKHHLPLRSVRYLTTSEKELIYYEEYWEPVGCNRLPAKVAIVHFDSGVNCGKSRAALWLQLAAGTTQDGIIGPKTLAAAQFITPQQLITIRRGYYAALIAARPKLGKYRNGWSNRLKALQRFVDNLPPL